jgi:hypothetical protein
VDMVGSDADLTTCAVVEEVGGGFHPGRRFAQPVGRDNPSLDGDSARWSPCP